MANQYYVGSKPRLAGDFKLSGVYADPTTVTFKMRSPSGTTTTYVYGTNAELVKSSTGQYYVDFPVTEQGEWWYRFAGTGTVTAASEAFLVVKESHF